MESNNVFELIRKRRTIRRFTDQPVSDDQIHPLLVAAMSAPSIMDRRPWHFVVVRDASVKKLVSDGLRLHPYVERAPVLIVALVDTSASPTWRLEMAAAVENIHLQAVAMGLGSAWIGSPDMAMEQQVEEQLREVLSLPITMKLFAFVAVGYPAEQRAAHELDPYFVGTHVHYDSWEGLKL